MKKKVICIWLVLILVILSIFLIIYINEKKKSKTEIAATPKEAVEKFLKNLEQVKLTEASKWVDWPFAYRFYFEGFKNNTNQDYSSFETISLNELEYYQLQNEYGINYLENEFKKEEKNMKELSQFILKYKIKNTEKIEKTDNIYKIESLIEIRWKRNPEENEKQINKSVNFYAIKKEECYYLISGVLETQGVFSEFIVEE